ncbi:Uncharacterized protein TCM_000580 [Theobroma cacao]|uniref:Rapid ALkalinization Factor n=1 Tax=Theobroma cacao TaxID=3641 RepID=A0A061DN07_THECC|nr:Uncharacterized protein TCM_000580 [Theobroma cacao]
MAAKPKNVLVICCFCLLLMGALCQISSGASPLNYETLHKDRNSSSPCGPQQSKNCVTARRPAKEHQRGCNKSNGCRT